MHRWDVMGMQTVSANKTQLSSQREQEVVYYFSFSLCVCYACCRHVQGHACECECVWRLKVDVGNHFPFTVWLQGFDYHSHKWGMGSTPGCSCSVMSAGTSTSQKISDKSQRGQRAWDPMGESTDPRLKMDMYASGYSVEELGFMRCQISSLTTVLINPKDPEPSAGACVVKFIFMAMLKHRLLFFFHWHSLPGSKATMV